MDDDDAVKDALTRDQTTTTTTTTTTKPPFGVSSSDDDDDDDDGKIDGVENDDASTKSSSSIVDIKRHQHKENFVEFMKTHGKRYCPENKPTEIERPCSESIKREKIFETNLLKMNEHNAKSGKAFGMRVTEFADLTQEEFIAKHLTYKSWKKEQMEIAANRAGRQPDDPKVEIPAEIEKSFEKSFGKLEKDLQRMKAATTLFLHRIWNRKSLYQLSSKPRRDSSSSSSSSSSRVILLLRTLITPTLITMLMLIIITIINNRSSSNINKNNKIKTRRRVKMLTKGVGVMNRRSSPTIPIRTKKSLVKFSASDRGTPSFSSSVGDDESSESSSERSHLFARRGQLPGGIFVDRPSRRVATGLSRRSSRSTRHVCFVLRSFPPIPSPPSQAHDQRRHRHFIGQSVDELRR